MSVEDFAAAGRRASGNSHADPEDAPPAEPDAGAGLLDDTLTFLRRFVAYPSDHAAIAHTLWIGHAHLMDAWESTPRIAFLSPEPASGKTRALEVTELLVPRPVTTINVTPAYLFRRMADEAGLPTVLFDEIDTLFGPKANGNEEVRGLLNAGHRRGGVSGRCVVHGKIVMTEDLPAYCALAMAGLGWLPDSITTRAVIIRMRRRAPNEKVEAYRRRSHAGAGAAIRRRLEAWALTVVADVTDAWPEMPAGIEDRNADVWEALLAVADAAAGDWPRLARKAATALVAEAMDHTPSLGVRLLADLRTVFGDRDVMRTTDIIAALLLLDEAPWADLRGKPIDARGLSTRLRQYGVKRTVIRFGQETARGYERAALADAWARYLSPTPEVGNFGNTVTGGPKTAETPDSGVTDRATPVTDPSVTVSASVTPEAGDSADVTDVTDVTDFRRGREAGQPKGRERVGDCANCGTSVFRDNMVTCDTGELLHWPCIKPWRTAHPDMMIEM